LRIAGREKIAKFVEEHLDAAPPMNRWVAIVSAAEWRNTAQLRDTFRDADFVSGKVVFNIGGNTFRLIASISFEARLVLLVAVLTHKEYDKGKWK